VFGILGRHRTALAVVEMEEGDALARPRLVTGPFAYVRLRKGDYSDAELREWAEWMRAQAVPVFCYLKHEELGPVLARRLAAQIDPGGAVMAGPSMPAASPPPDASRDSEGGADPDPLAGRAPELPAATPVRAGARQRPKPRA
jgi:hypothetical protein